MNLNNQYINLSKNVDKMLADIREEQTVPKVPGILTKDFLKHLNRITAEYKECTVVTMLENYKQIFGQIGTANNTDKSYIPAFNKTFKKAFSDKPSTELGLQNER